MTGRQKTGLALSAAILTLALAVVASTWANARIPLGYVVGCAVLAALFTSIPWPAGVLGGILQGTVVLPWLVLRDSFYDRAALLSAAWLQSIAIYVGAVAAAVLVRGAILVFWRPPRDAAAT